jgi:hypothetical protein
VRRTRITSVALTTLVVSLALAAPALAGRGGEGTYGRVNDKVTTNVGFLLMIFFTLLVIVLSLAQAALERRKRSK